MDFAHFSLMGYREKGYSTQRIFAEHAEQVKHAEQADFGAAWFAEHHFSNYCTCPSPLMMAAHCAGFTSKIRLGPAVVVTPLYEPARLLAEIGMVDAMSNGRLNVGVGSGYQPYEFDRFHVELEHSKEMMEEFLDMLHLAFTQDLFNYDGKHYQMPETHIAARPVKPFSTIMVAGDNDYAHRLCARRGLIPLFTGRWKGVDYVKERRDVIAGVFAEEGKDPDRMPVAFQRFLHITDSRAEALEYAEHCRHQMRLASALRRRAENISGGMMNEIPFPGESTLEEMVDALPIGSVETVAERLCAEIRAANPCQIMFHIQVGGSTQAQALNTIEKFATAVRPLIEKELGPLDAIGVMPEQLAAE